MIHFVAIVNPSWNCQDPVLRILPCPKIYSMLHIQLGCRGALLRKRDRTTWVERNCVHAIGNHTAGVHEPAEITLVPFANLGRGMFWHWSGYPRAEGSGKEALGTIWCRLLLRPFPWGGRACSVANTAYLTERLAKKGRNNHSQLATCARPSASKNPKVPRPISVQNIKHASLISPSQRPSRLPATCDQSMSVTEV